jgi:predicted nicotinamide N-methyase
VVTSPRAFVLRHTRLRPVPGLGDIRLHLADDVLLLWGAVQVETDDPDAALPYWAFAWAGGLALGRYLREHPGVVAGRRVFDLASGSGLCAIGAVRAGASAVTAADIDAFAAAAIGLNAHANRCRVTVVRRDVLDDDPPDADVILAGDCWYDGRLAARVLPWLQRARDRGIDVLVGDPGRRYLPTDELVELTAYDVRTTTELEDLELRRGRVYALRPVVGPTAPPRSVQGRSPEPSP